MKKIVLLAFYSLFWVTTSQAQVFNWGVRVGVSTPDVKPRDLNPLKLKSATDSFSLKVADAKYGFHFGGWFRLNAGRLFLQPEVNFNSNKVDFSFKNLKLLNAVDSVVNENYLRLDIPVFIGVKLGGLRLSGGPVGHLHLSSSSELKSAIKNYEQNFKSMTWGYQAGLGLGFGNIGIDIRYEGNFNNFGNHITFGNTQYEFSKAPSRFLVSMAINF